MTKSTKSRKPKKTSTNIIPLRTIDQPHPRKGEDGQPLAFSLENRTLLAVADGMGGRGATKVNINGIEYTHAHVAAYATLEKIKELFNNGYTGDEIKSALEEKKQFEGLPTSKSLIRGTMSDDYPTTVVFAIITEEKENFVIDIFWAGDSKAFIFLSDKVFVTKDHDRSNASSSFDEVGLESVSLNGTASFAHTVALTRYLAKTKGHKIEKCTIRVSKEEFIGVLLASDGLFDYMGTKTYISINPILNILQGKSIEEAIPNSEQTDDISVAIMQNTFVPSRSNPASLSLESIALAGLVGFLIGKKF